MAGGMITAARIECEKAEDRAHPNPAASAILESLHPAMKAAMPETVKKAKQNLRALKQAKERLMDLMVEVAKK